MMVGAEEHRELVRKCLRLLIAEGYRPMHFYSTDLKKYYYLGELMALVDLSLVRRLSISALRSRSLQAMDGPTAV